MQNDAKLVNVPLTVVASYSPSQVWAHTILRRPFIVPATQVDDFMSSLNIPHVTFSAPLYNIHSNVLETWTGKHAVPVDDDGEYARSPGTRDAFLLEYVATHPNLPVASQELLAVESWQYARRNLVFNPALHPYVLPLLYRKHWDEHTHMLEWVAINATLNTPAYIHRDGILRWLKAQEDPFIENALRKGMSAEEKNVLGYHHAYNVGESVPYWELTTSR